MLHPLAPALLQADFDPAQIGAALGGCFGLGVASLLVIVIFLFPIFCFWKICSKAGYPGALSLIQLIPGIGMIILLCILAFGNWPNQRING
jgi:hypothetical protein